MTETFTQKNELRRELKSVKACAQISISEVISLLNPRPTSYIGLFKPMKDEPSLTDLPDTYNYVWPRITDEACGLMAFHSGEEFGLSKLGFHEPLPVTKVKPVEHEDIFCMFVPGLAFDYRGVRLGRGKGFYDRYLKNYKGLKIGVCTKERFLNKPIPFIKGEDVDMDWILTDQHLYKVNTHTDIKKVV